MDHEAVNALREPRIAALVRIPDPPGGLRVRGCREASV